MNKKVKIDSLPVFDMADHLDSDASVAEYLPQVLTDGDGGELAHALGHIAKARGMAQIAKDAGIGRESLCKALRADANPRLETISRVCRALGVKLVAQPLAAPAPTLRQPRAHRLPPYGADQSPDFPPCFSSTRICPITMPRSAALHMS